MNPGLLFALRFGAGWLFFVALVGWIPSIEGAGIDATIWTVDGVLRWFPTPSLVTGNHISFGHVSFEIVPECTPLMPIGILGSAILAFPAPWLSRLRALLFGAAVLWTYNLLRILALFGIMAWWPKGFELVHVYLWQPMTLLAVAGCFLVWIQSVTSKTVLAHPIAAD